MSSTSTASNKTCKCCVQMRRVVKTMKHAESRVVQVAQNSGGLFPCFRYSTIKQCWFVRPEDRPNFTQLVSRFGNLLESHVRQVRSSASAFVSSSRFHVGAVDVKKLMSTSKFHCRHQF